MSETIFKNIGLFLQDSCLSACLTHPEEQISYINISPYEVESRFMCIECYQSSSFSKEEKNQLISLRKFILKQEQEPHFQILPENVRQEVQETLQTKGRVNLQEKIKQFSDSLIEAISKEMRDIQRKSDEKTCLIYEKKDVIQSLFNELTNPQKIFDIFDSNRRDIDQLNSQIDQYIKVIYVKVNQIQESALEYEELFGQFNIDEAQIIKQKIVDRLKQVKFYIPNKNSQNNSENNKSIFEENPLLIDDSQLSQKNRAFLKLIQQIPNINQNLLYQIEKKLQNYPIFDDIDFENEVQNDDQQIFFEEQQKNNQNQQQLTKQKSQSEQQIPNDSLSQLSEQQQQLEIKKKSFQDQKQNEQSKQKELTQQCINTEQQTEQDNQFSRQKQMVISDAISPIEKHENFKRKQNIPKLNQQQVVNEEFSEKDLTEFLSNALNDEIPFTKFSEQHKNHQKNKSQLQNNTIQLHQISNQSLLRESSSQMNSVPNTTSNRINQQQLNYRQQPQFNSQTLQSFQNSNETNSSEYIIQITDQQKMDQQKLLQRNSEQITSQQQMSALQLQKHQSSNIDNFHMIKKGNELEINDNNKYQSKSRDMTPISKYPDLSALKNKSLTPQDKNNKNINPCTIEKQNPIKEEESNGRKVSNQSSGFTMNESEESQKNQKENQIKPLQGLLQFEGQKLSLKMKKSRLGSNEGINISHQQNNTIIIEQPTDQYAHYIISKDTLEPQQDYAFLFSIRCAKTDSVLIGITPKEYVNEKVLHKMPFYKSFINTTYESFSQSCEKIEKGKSIKCVDENSLHVVMRVSIQNEILQFYDYPQMQNINSIKNPSDLKSIKKFYLTIGLARSKESLNNNSCPLRIQILDMKIIDVQTNSEDVNNKNGGVDNNNNK